MKKAYLISFLLIFFLSGIKAQNQPEGKARVIMVLYPKGYGDFDFYLNGYQAFNVDPASVVSYTHYTQKEIEVLVKEPLSEFVAGDFFIKLESVDTLFFEVVSKIPGGVDGFVYKRTSEEFWWAIHEFEQRNKKKKKNADGLFWVTASEFPKKNTVAALNESNQKFGTGFLAPNSSFIFASLGLVKNAKAIHIKGINGLKNTSFLATIHAVDTNLNIALLQLLDSFSISSAPYPVNQKQLTGGEYLYTMGYEAVGQGISTYEGIVDTNNNATANENYKKLLIDVNKSFVCAPLFSKTAHLVGIIAFDGLTPVAITNNKIIPFVPNIIIQENKSSVSELSSKTLGEQSKILQNFIYLIEVE